MQDTQEADQVIEIDTSRYVGIWYRFLARILDGIFLSIIGSPFLVIMTVIAYRAGVTSSNGELTNLDTIRYSPRQSLVIGLCSLAYVVLTGLYFVLLNSSKLQGSLGKRILGFKIVDEHGERLTRGKALTRYLASDGLGVPYSLLGNSTNPLAKNIAGFFGFIYGVYFITDASIGGADPRKQTLHDRLAKTFVVRR